MANAEHLSILKQGVDVWNAWRKKNPHTQPNLWGANLAEMMLAGANLSGTILSKASLHDADLSRANLFQTNLNEADLHGATLCGASLSEANFFGADLHGADLSCAQLDRADLGCANLTRARLDEAELDGADLSGANLREANLYQANLRNASLVQTDLTKANLSGCRIFGISVWEVELEDAAQLNLVITRSGEPIITVDNLEVAQFVYLLLNNEKVRDIINTITTKVVLILGRFTPERKIVLDTIRDELRKRNYLPILFDSDKPSSRDLTETISTLAHLARFIIADITDPRSIPQELETIIPNLPSVPIQPLLLSSQREYGMFEHFMRYPWVLPIRHYSQVDDLLASLGDKVIAPAETKAKELQAR